uniref:Ubiquitin-like domain-containing protein n=1 Tax=Panagrolaimus sp. JU765 TaxID=591449 RepID=A0AC34QW56_9BILA
MGNENFDDSKDQSYSMIIFVKNEKGVAMPIYVKAEDPVELIWSEIGYSTAINERTLKGKGLYYRNRKLDVSKNLADYQIHRGDVIELRKE